MYRPSSSPLIRFAHTATFAIGLLIVSATMVSAQTTVTLADTSQTTTLTAIRRA